jgi:hypothetical protein
MFRILKWSGDENTRLPLLDQSCLSCELSQTISRTGKIIHKLDHHYQRMMSDSFIAASGYSRQIDILIFAICIAWP